MQQQPRTPNGTASRTWIVAAIAALALGLAACDRAKEEPTVGQRLDTAVAATERKAEEIASDVKAGASEMASTVRSETAQVAEATSVAVKDAAITAAINAKLAADKSLSAVRIDVDTERGHVTLAGEAPSGEARNRATALASSVDGVVTVDNRLVARTSN